MPAVVLDRTLVAWSGSRGRASAQREREEHAYRWRPSEAQGAWVGEERSEVPRAAPDTGSSAELVHDLRHQLTRAELEFEAGEPDRARAALTRAREACEEALGLRASAPVDLVALCSEEARAAARARPGREIQTSLPRECSLVCAPAALRRLLANLLDNALRESGAGEAVLFALEREPDGGARLSVEDRGPGFRADAVDARLGGRASGSGSTGIGSLSVLECARRLRATIRLSSGPGEGARFELRLPG